MPQLNQKDILAQREIEVELKKKQKQSIMASTKWGGPDPVISAAVNQLAGFTSDLRRIDDLKRLKENLLQAPPSKSLFLKQTEFEEKRMLQRKNAFQSTTTPHSVSPSRNGAAGGAMASVASKRVPNQQLLVTDNVFVPQSMMPTSSMTPSNMQRNPNSNIGVAQRYQINNKLSPAPNRKRYTSSGII